MDTNSYSKKYYANNKDKILALQRERRKDPLFRQKMKIYYRNYYKENRNKILEQSRTRRSIGRRGDGDNKQTTIIRGVFIVSF